MKAFKHSVPLSGQTDYIVCKEKNINSSDKFFEKGKR